MSFLDLAKAPPPQIKTSKRGRKPKGESSNHLKEELIISPDYRPAGWKENGLSFAETIAVYDALNKKKSDLTESESVIAHNYDILKSCYRTPEYILGLANQLIGKFNFDAFYNDLGYTGNSKYATEDFRKLSGYSSEDDGFSLSNWTRITTDLEQPVGFKNPPFNKLEDAARIANAFIESDKRSPRLVFLGTLDFTQYLQESLRVADYLLMLGRVNFLPMPGVKTSSPRGSVGMLIYNPLLDIGNSRFIMYQGQLYYAIDLRKERNTLNLQQLSLELGNE